MLITANMVSVFCVFIYLFPYAMSNLVGPTKCRNVYAQGLGNSFWAISIFVNSVFSCGSVWNNFILNLSCVTICH